MKTLKKYYFKQQKKKIQNLETQFHSVPNTPKIHWRINVTEDSA
jgi:hypothetical protein